MTLRALLVMACVALAACTAPAAQDSAQPAAASTHVAKYQVRTGGPQQAERVDNTCKVDADCAAKPRCIGTDCRCVNDTCIAKREAIDPVIDPVPASSVR